MLFLILDAPPHGIRFGTSYECPCMITEEKFMPELKRMNIKFFVIKPKGVDGIEKMIKLFEKYTVVSIKEFSGGIREEMSPLTSTKKHKHEMLKTKVRNITSLSTSEPVSINKNIKVQSEMNAFICSNVMGNLQKQIAQNKNK